MEKLSNTTLNISKKELACIVACIASYLQNEKFEIISIRKSNSKWNKYTKEMLVSCNQMFYNWR